MPDYKQARKEARARATALGHTMSPFVIYVGQPLGDRQFAAICHRCQGEMIHNQTRGTIEGAVLLGRCR